ncbi:MAG: TerC family protein [Pseudomonadota bacterium]
MASELLASPEIWASLLTLTALEIVLGVDNVIFISLLASRLPEPAASRARRFGLLFALITRVAFLSGVFWLTQLTATVVEVLGAELSWRDLILLGGGLFLIVKATLEIHHAVEHGSHGEQRPPDPGRSFILTVVQIALIDIVFSVDSVITAVGLASQIWVMVVAISISIAVMYLSSGGISRFIARHPTTKMLALSFLLLIGMALIGDALDFHIPRGYLYAAMGFSVLVELLNIAASRGRRAAR